MGGWISKAKNVFQRDVVEAAQPFEISCQCGQKHAGLRRAHHQHLTCRVCGVAIFVLPRDVYPPPVENPQVKVRPLAGVSAKEVSANEVDTATEIPSAAPLSLPPVPRKKSRPANQTSRRAGASKGRKASTQSPAAAATSPRPAWFRPLLIRSWNSWRGFWTPFRLVLACIGGLLLATAGYSVHRAALSRAAAIVVEKTESGRQHLEQKKWLAARDDLQQSARALDLLGRTDPEAQSIRQDFHESQALSRLSREGVFDILTAAASHEPEKAGEPWERVFARQYHGDWIVLDAEVRRRVIRDKKVERSESYVDLQWSPDGKAPTARIRADLPVLEAMIPAGGSARIIFAAPLEACVHPADGQGWELVLDGAQGFLWARPERYRELGFADDAPALAADWTAVLAQQSQQLGLTP